MLKITAGFFLSPSAVWRGTGAELATRQQCAWECRGSGLISHFPQSDPENERKCRPGLLIFIKIIFSSALLDILKCNDSSEKQFDMRYGLSGK